MLPEERNTGQGKLCSFSLCGATAHWYTDFFGDTEYYCDRHKPVIPQSLLKRAGAVGGASPREGEH